VNRYSLVATSSFGLEAVVASELAALGYEAATENGRILFEGGEEDIARCNIRLRVADRLLIRLAEFPAADLDDIYEGINSIAWRDFLPRNPRIAVTARAPHGRLNDGQAARPGRHVRTGLQARAGAAPSRAFAVPSLQSVGKKAIVDAILGKKGGARVEESGPLYAVEIVVVSGRASVLLDTSGDGLHKRGYRREAGEAPLRETLAAGMILLSKWDQSRPFWDPLCGSGTIPIEAALIGLNIAPGATRGFAAEQWAHIPADVWRKARAEAGYGVRRDAALRISGSDSDARVLAAAGRNAERAGVSSAVSFTRARLEDLHLQGEYGCIVTNPPYAERMGHDRDVEILYKSLGALRRGNPTWSLFALSAHPRFAGLIGERESRNRKLYNGKIRCYFHQYFGPLPRGGNEI
jgi:putative N6-adenine-specific DNA methylase